jgi:hypothetical protein
MALTLSDGTIKTHFISFSPVFLDILNEQPLSARYSGFSIHNQLAI